MSRLRNRGSWWPVLKQVTKLLYFELAPIQWKSLICLQGNCFHYWPFLLHWNAHEWYSLSILVSCTVTFLHATAVIFLLSLISLLTIISCDTSICMDDVFVDHFLSFFVYFSTRQLWYFFFFDCRCAVSLHVEECSVFRFFQAYLIFIVMAFSVTRPFDAAASIPQQVRSSWFIDEFCFGSLWPRRPCFARALWR